MRIFTTASLSAVALTLLAPAAPIWAQPKTGAWERWGITKPVADPAAEPRFVTAMNQLYADQYDSARQSYAALVKDYPKSAEAHLGMSMADRYLAYSMQGEGLRDSALAEAKAAVALDPDGTGPLCNYADLYETNRDAYPSEPMSDSVRFAVSTEAARKAAATSHRYSVYAHVALWADYLWAGRLSDARQEMQFLGEQGYFPPMLLDFGRNLMDGLPRDAVLFTNGDNDTEPLLSLQAAEAFRRDVTVVNGTFLSVPKLMAVMRDTLKLPLTLTDQELAGKPKWSDVLDNIITNAQKQNRPVYFAATFDPDMMGKWKDYTISEGLASRVDTVKHPDSTDVARVLENEASWRLTTAGQKVDWPACMSPMVRHIDQLNINYMAVYMDLAQYFQKQGDTVKVEEMCRRTYGLIEHLDDPMRTAQIVKMWLSLNPNSAEAAEIDRKLAAESKNLESLTQPSAADTAARAAATDSVLFRTSEPAPSGFETWTFFWVHPTAHGRSADRLRCPVRRWRGVLPVGAEAADAGRQIPVRLLAGPDRPEQTVREGNRGSVLDHQGKAHVTGRLRAVVRVLQEQAGRQDNPGSPREALSNRAPFGCRIATGRRPPDGAKRCVHRSSRPVTGDYSAFAGAMSARRMPAASCSTAS